MSFCVDVCADDCFLNKMEFNKEDSMWLTQEPSLDSQSPSFDLGFNYIEEDYLLNLVLENWEYLWPLLNFLGCNCRW